MSNESGSQNPVRYVLPSLQWLVQTLVLLGVVSTYLFVKVNLGDDFSIEIPETPVLRKR